MAASSATKRQRQRRRIDEDGDPEFQVAPMVDVLLVLMLFFMAITSTEVLKKDKNLTLAEANHAKEDKDKRKPNELVVNVSWGNETAHFSMDGVAYPTADALQSVLGAQHQLNPHAYVLVRADKDVEYSNISDVMNACAAAGIGTVSFAVITNPGKSAAPTSAPDGGP
jgi:biopolymer transport protein ExbD